MTHKTDTHTHKNTSQHMCVCVPLENTYHIPDWHSTGLYGKGNFSFQAALSSGENEILSAVKKTAV